MSTPTESLAATELEVNADWSKFNASGLAKIDSINTLGSVVPLGFRSGGVPSWMTSISGGFSLEFPDAAMLLGA